MRRRYRQRRPARSVATKPPKPLILVVCEGKLTEPQYVRGFRSECENPRVEIEVQEGKGVPRTVVEYARDRKHARNQQAKREKDDNLRYDQVWCVFDVDEHPNLSDAKQMARDNELMLAISNPCIELWLYLHFADQPGQQERGQMQRKLKKHLPGFDKHVEYRLLSHGYQQAVKRAEQLETAAAADGEPDRNPTTGMWRLTESIRTN